MKVRYKLENTWVDGCSAVAGWFIRRAQMPLRRYGSGFKPLPPDGEREFLVNGYCKKCNYRCACPDGWAWPLCPNCGLRVFPQRATRPDGGFTFGNSKGYIATVMPEGEAVMEIVNGGGSGG
jgi:hypothetical protein